MCFRQASVFQRAERERGMEREKKRKRKDKGGGTRGKRNLRGGKEEENGKRIAILTGRKLRRSHFSSQDVRREHGKREEKTTTEEEKRRTLAYEVKVRRKAKLVFSGCSPLSRASNFFPYLVYGQKEASFVCVAERGTTGLQVYIALVAFDGE